VPAESVGSVEQVDVELAAVVVVALPLAEADKLAEVVIVEKEDDDVKVAFKLILIEDVIEDNDDVDGPAVLLLIPLLLLLIPLLLLLIPLLLLLIPLLLLLIPLLLLLRGTDDLKYQISDVT
jgi:hypothetical protein